MIRTLREGKGQGLDHTLGTKLPVPEGNPGAGSKTQARVTVRESDTYLPNPRQNAQVEVRE